MAGWMDGPFSGYNVFVNLATDACTIVTVLFHLFCLSKLEKQHSFKGSVNLVKTEVGKRGAIL